MLHTLPLGYKGEKKKQIFSPFWVMIKGIMTDTSNVDGANNK